jgi:CelD/BcsL family acetyltransferase involved in cellulose biosynthesis
MPVDWVDDPVAFTAPGWATLAETDPEATFFHSPRFLKPYWEEFGTGRLAIASVPHGNGILAMSAFEVRDRLLAFLGGFEVTDYMGPVGGPSDRELAAKELMAGMAARDDWDRADLRGLPRDGRWLTCLAEAAPSAGLACQVEEDGVAPWLALPASFDAYLAALPGKRRHEIRRKERRLREAFPDVHLVDATSRTMDEDLDRFVELHRSSAGEKGKFMVPGMELFFRRLADILLPTGAFRLAFLEAGGRKIAGAVGFRDRGAFRLYNSAYDDVHAAVAPGIVLVAELIRSAIEEGCSGLDFLKGDLAYKYRFGPRRRRIARLLLTRA